MVYIAVQTINILDCLEQNLKIINKRNLNFFFSYKLRINNEGFKTTI